MITIAISRLVYSHKKYNKKMKATEVSDDLFRQILASKDKEETLNLLCKHIANNQSMYLEFVINTYTQITDGFVNDDLKSLRRADSALRTEKSELKKMRRKEMVGLQRIDKEVAIEKNTWFHLGSNSCQQIMYGLRRICEPCEEHVDNNFKPMPQELVKEFIPLRDTLVYLLERTHTVVTEGRYNEVDEIRTECDHLKESLSRTRKLQINRMQDVKSNLTVSYVYLNILQETQELVSSLRHLLRAAYRFHMPA